MGVARSGCWSQNCQHTLEWNCILDFPHWWQCPTCRVTKKEFPNLNVLITRKPNDKAIHVQSYWEQYQDTEVDFWCQQYFFLTHASWQSHDRPKLQWREVVLTKEQDDLVDDSSVSKTPCHGQTQRVELDVIINHAWSWMISNLLLFTNFSLIHWTISIEKNELWTRPTCMQFSSLL